jgi:hypothetical protein
MSSADFWFIRLPDGRVLRAASTAVVRQELGSGRIPAGSTVRRSPEEAWVAIEWTREFSDVAAERRAAEAQQHEQAGQRRDSHPAVPRTRTVASRLDSERLRQVGVHDLIQELQAALDSTLVAPKLLIAAVAGLALGILATVMETGAFDLGNQWLNLGAIDGLRNHWLDLVVVFAVVGVVFSLAAGLLTQLTYVEVSRLRLARWREGMSGLGGLAVRILIGLAVVSAGAWGLIALLRWLPFWLLPSREAPEATLRDVLPGAVLAAGMAFEACVWAVLSTAPMLAPLLVVERCSIVGAVVRWLSLLRRHLGRVFLFEALAVGFAIVMTLPFVALWVPLRGMYVPERLILAWVCARNLLAGIVGGLFMAYVIVANLFIYLHLHYTLDPRR